jgi:hypothetical protein
MKHSATVGYGPWSRRWRRVAEPIGRGPSFQRTHADMKMRAVMRAVVLAIGIAFFLVGGSALAADEQAMPPQNAKKLSEILAKVEKRGDFRYVKEVDWSKDGYTVTYYTTDKAKVEITYDPVTGEPK